MIKIYCSGKEITEIVTMTSWSGDSKQAARTLEIGIASSSSDYYLPKVNIKMGDLVTFEKDGVEIFKGYVFFKEKSIDDSEMSVTVYDGLIYLLKSKGSYNFKNMTPGAITKKICSDFGIPIGNIKEGSPMNHIFDKITIYEMITTAYQEETNKTGIVYLPRMEDGKLNVLDKGEKLVKFILDPKTTIVNSTYGESMENSINRVKILSEKGESIGEVTLDDIPGVLQDIYVKEKGKNATTQAKELLKGIERTASIEALGDIECISGNTVVIKEPYTGLSGVFYIDNDTHTFSNGQHTMSLGLSFKEMGGS